MSTGVFEMKSVHLIDLINYHFDIKHILEPILLNQSKKGTSPDTSHIKILTNNKANNIFFLILCSNDQKANFILIV